MRMPTARTLTDLGLAPANRDTLGIQPQTYDIFIPEVEIQIQRQRQHANRDTLGIRPQT